MLPAKMARSHFRLAASERGRRISRLAKAGRRDVPTLRFVKVREHHGDVICWDQSNGAYILTRAISGVE